MQNAYSVIIPTRNAEKYIGSLLTALQGQTVKPEKIIVVDSESTDRTVQISREAGAETIVIRKADFDHGGTRDMAFRRTDTPFVVFMTQDAFPARQDAIAKLLAPFRQNERLALVGGRQIPYPEASAHEKLVRQHNYPPDTRIWDQSQCEALGIRAFLISNVFAAYRADAYRQVGGFDHPILTNEDMLITQRFLAAGFQAAYAGEASVYHSHNFSWREQFRRNYIVGQTMVRYADRFQARELGTGVSLAASVSRSLLQERKLAAFCAFLWDCSARFSGNRLGRLSEQRRMKKHEAR